MNTTEILTKVNHILAHYDAKSSAPEKVELEQLADDLRSKLRMEAATSRGHLDATKAAVRVMKNADDRHQSALRYAWEDSAGRQCFADGYQAYRLADHLELAPRPENAGTPIDLDKVFAAYHAGEEIKLPTVVELKASINEQRAKRMASTTLAYRRANPFAPIWDFGADIMTVNAEYLLQAIAIMGDDVKAFAALSAGQAAPHQITPLYFRSARGEGILLPIRVESKVKAYQERKAQEAKPKSDEMIQAEERVARCERRVKDLQRQFDNAIAQYRRENAAKDEPGTIDLTPDEFAGLMVIKGSLANETKLLHERQRQLDALRKTA